MRIAMSFKQDKKNLQSAIYASLIALRYLRSPQYHSQKW